MFFPFTLVVLSGFLAGGLLTIVPPIRAIFTGLMQVGVQQQIRFRDEPVWFATLSALYLIVSGICWVAVFQTVSCFVKHS